MKNMWIHVKAHWLKEDNLEELGIKSDDYTLEDYIFDLNELEAYNRSENGFTTIRLKSGFSITINERFENFDKFFKMDRNVYII